ncbi:helix-turn-helix domain-containing protein, partial [Streptomyces scabiei]|uniref:helix-turn-helix domain-containing protein n=1 Tax=Streptomyces scabiei TaxID=1930 RepID=UPI0038D3A849
GPRRRFPGFRLRLSPQARGGMGRVARHQSPLGGCAPFPPSPPRTHWTGRRVRLPEALPGQGITPAPVLDPDDEDTRVAALDTFLTGLAPDPDPQADLAMALVTRIRADRTIRRVADFARAEGVSVRVLQRLFSAYVGVGPKWVILRYRIHEALERAETDRAVDWAALAADLGYADQAHLVRDFTATVGVPPRAYAQALSPA